MTIAIAAYGPDAGQAVARGLLAAELLGRGAIGGFAVFSVLDGQGGHRQHCCQDGGIGGLALDRVSLSAGRVAVISSGPDRPEPLSQFLAAREGVGLVTGHRLPNRPGAAGPPVNRDALDRMAAGLSPAEAVTAVTAENPEVDFGLIALSADGRIGVANSARVERRADLDDASGSGCGRGYAMLCNSICTLPGLSLRRVVGDIVWSALCGEPAHHEIAKLAAPVPIGPATIDRVEIDEEGKVVAIFTADPGAMADSPRSTVIQSRMPVWRNGSLVGSCLSELLAPVRDGMAALSPDFQTSFVIEKVSN